MTLAELLPAMRQLPALAKWLHRHFSTRNASGNILFLEALNRHGASGHGAQQACPLRRA